MYKYNTIEIGDKKMNNEYIIATDSATDMPQFIIDEYKLHVIPTPVVIDGKDYFDGKTIMPKEFYQLLREDKAKISTYHINTFMFKENFRQYAEAGQSVVYPCFSTGLAGTYNAARLAREELIEEFPNFDMTIVDSKCASVGFGLLVYYALMMQKNGADKKTVIEALEYHRDHIEHIFTVNTLEYLYRGGRLSKATKILGGMLDLKPLIQLTDEGSLEAFDKIRGRNKALNRCAEVIGERCKNPGEQIIGLSHGDDMEALAKLRKLMEKKYGCVKFVETYVGCAIGAHTGPGIIAVTCLDEESPYKEYFD